MNGSLKKHSQITLLISVSFLMLFLLLFFLIRGTKVYLLEITALGGIKFISLFFFS